MILILGSGYIGSAFASECRRRGLDYRLATRKQWDYTKFGTLAGLFCHLRDTKPTLLINAAGFTGRADVDDCEDRRGETFKANVLLPLMISHACEAAWVPWAHVSSGCIYNGAGPFSEDDPPNFCFRHPPCSYYSGTKAHAEELIAESQRCYIWRLRMPFDEFDGPRNYLSKLRRYGKLLEARNSLSHRGDFVKACLDLWTVRAPFGTYNVTNPGSVTTCQIINMMQQFMPPREFRWWESDEEFYQRAAVAPRSNCVLDVSKLLNAGVKIRPVFEALEHAITAWIPGKVASPSTLNPQLSTLSV